MANISKETAWKSIENELNLSSYWVNQTINDWNIIDYFMELVEEESTIDRKIATAKIMKDLELAQAALIRVPETSSSSSSKPSKKRDIDKEVKQIEYDSITVPGLDISLATIIKRKAVKCHKSFVLNPGNLTPRQIKIMFAGLSSILDLQTSLLAHKDQSSLQSSGIILTLILKENLQLNDIHLLHHNEKKIIRENEYLRLIWSYILEQLFPTKGIVHVSTGEGENAYSTESKKEQYPKANSLWQAHWKHIFDDKSFWPDEAAARATQMLRRMHAENKLAQPGRSRQPHPVV
ncbi:hypothetical protein G6F57_007471 [Rhizopus arrhizus]|uniref:Uncharacterized protein n=1 Tax=Rhizopus oryzae TaxID=64495 RepID=A0A9P6X716_RHIOR|nr:hypothetical protein G6F23_003572 [Rhizopus arrhizus]KAG1419498.1 hypothetical protein G6F58_004586 [Rhizopus delemar]KAG0760947.1 hypothetical protein G6F24_007930 [Rhizopus arrhizus]KAG0788248.1 hypothetical protein G6F21_007345 [Rhizopus arrhizus]KAG0799865.1 hypothetical protein G6F22_002801 [Rhizopus arrhizus]